MTNNLPPSSPWSVPATIGFSILIFIVFLGVQTVAIFALAASRINSDDATAVLNEVQLLVTNGFAISVSLIPSALFGSLLVLLFTYLKKNTSVKEYLRLKAPDLKQLLFWIGILILFNLGLEIVNHFIERPIPGWMIESYKTAGSLPLFWFALVVAAPVFEELFFRGFMLEGLRHSKLGNLGAVIITAAIWAAIHLQYELFEVATIFLIGLVLGYAKIKTDSLYTVIILHALMNFVATLQVATL